MDGKEVLLGVHSEPDGPAPARLLPPAPERVHYLPNDRDSWMRPAAFPRPGLSLLPRFAGKLERRCGNRGGALNPIPRKHPSTPSRSMNRTTRVFSTGRSRLESPSFKSGRSEDRTA